MDSILRRARGEMGELGLMASVGTKKADPAGDLAGQVAEAVEPSDSPEPPRCPDGYCRVTTASSLDEALATLPEDFTVPLLESIDKAQKSSTPAVGLMRIRTELIRELSAQAGCEGDGFDTEPGSLAPGETPEEAAVLCGALAQILGFVEELLDA